MGGRLGPSVIPRGIVYLYFAAVFGFIQRHISPLATAPFYTTEPHLLLAMNMGAGVDTMQAGESNAAL